MTPDDLRAIRLSLGLTQEAFGRALGYKGPNIKQMISRLERGVMPVPERVELKIEKLNRDGWPQRQTWRP